MAWPATLGILKQYEPMPTISQIMFIPLTLPRFCPLMTMLITHRYAASVGTNFGQRGMGCALPADRYFYPIANPGWIFFEKYTPLWQPLIFTSLCFFSDTTFCLAGLQREPSGFQAADHGGDGSHQGREEAERPGSLKRKTDICLDLLYWILLPCRQRSWKSLRIGNIWQMFE